MKIVALVGKGGLLLLEHSLAARQFGLTALDGGSVALKLGFLPNRSNPLAFKFNFAVVEFAFLSIDLNAQLLDLSPVLVDLLGQLRILATLLRATREAFLKALNFGLQEIDLTFQGQDCVALRLNDLCQGAAHILCDRQRLRRGLRRRLRRRLRGYARRAIGRYILCVAQPGAHLLDGQALIEHVAYGAK